MFEAAVNFASQDYHKFRFGNNHIPIQNFYLQEAVKDGDSYVLKTVSTIVEDSQDRFHDQCQMN